MENLFLTKSHLSLLGQKLKLQNKNGDTVSITNLDQIRSISVERISAIGPITIFVALAVGIAATAIFMPPSLWKNLLLVAISISLILSAIATQTKVIVVETKSGTLRIPLNDIDEEGYAFAMSVNSRINESDNTPSPLEANDDLLITPENTPERI